MICDYCKSWASTSRKQHRNRLANIDYNKAASVFACPRCGSGEWATTEQFIKDKDKFSLWERFEKFLMLNRK
jgi:hypothetical protein